MRKKKYSNHNKYVLALNRAWLPVDIIDYKDCFRLLCKGHAKALETINGSYVMHTMESWLDMHMKAQYTKLNTVSMEVPIPEIIILTEYDKIPQRFVKFTKTNLLIRDNYECAYCGCSLDLDTATIDHIVPQAKGGKTSWENCTVACKNCNHKKGDSPPEGPFKPKRKAKEPLYQSPIFQMKKKIGKMEILDSWKKFLFH